jgi:hypothetical protein
MSSYLIASTWPIINRSLNRSRFKIPFDYYSTSSEGTAAFTRTWIILIENMLNTKKTYNYFFYSPHITSACPKLYKIGGINVSRYSHWIDPKSPMECNYRTLKNKKIINLFFIYLLESVPEGTNSMTKA